MLPLMRRALLALLLFLVSFPAAAVTVERVVSPGGIEAWLVQDHSNPIIAVELAFKGGAALDPANKRGLAEMASGLLDEGAGPYDSQAFQQKLEDLVITLHFSAGLDATRGHLKTLTENRQTAFDLLRLSLTQARFDKEPVERVRGQILSNLARESQSPNAIASRAWFKAMFPDHPYAHSARGEMETVKTIQRGDLKAFVQGHIARDRLVIGVAGDVDPAELGRLLDLAFGGLPATGAAAVVPEATVSAKGGSTLIDRDIPQTVAVFGLPGLKRKDPDWYPAYVVNAILGGGGFFSRLTEEVREKRGLAYSVHSYLAPMRRAGLVLGGVATQNARFKESMDVIRAELRRMAEQGPTAEELAATKTFLNGSFPLQLDSSESVAGLMLQLQMDELGMDLLDRRAELINAVTIDDAKRVAARLFNPDALTLVAVGRPSGM